MTESHLRLTPKETNILGLKKKLDLAKGIIEKGGTPFHSESRLPNIQSFRTSTPQGNPWSRTERRFIAIRSRLDCKVTAELPSRINLLQCSSKISTNTKACKGEIYLMSYTLYEQIVADKPKILNINRAWHLGQQINMSHICGVTCDRCNSIYVAIKDFPEPYKACPICDTSIDSTGRQKWKCVQQGLKKHTKEFCSQYIFHSDGL